MSGWKGTLGAWPEGEGVRFRVWAPGQRGVWVELGEGEPRVVRLKKEEGGTHSKWIKGVRAGDRYRLRVEQGSFPDPASRFQPEGVHGPSEVVDPALFEWKDGEWKGRPLRDLVVYELHVGTFTEEGTYRAAIEKLPMLRELGMTAVELMPLADFPGRWNWGYDGSALFAPARSYGRPDELRSFVDTAHGLGLSVWLDVVYNHLGPDGCYVPTFMPEVFSRTNRSPWGRGLNFDGPGSEGVRSFFVENALYWIHEFHLDGLRLDATFAIEDRGPKHFLEELAERVKLSVAGREVHVVAEDHRNLARLVRSREQEGYGLDSQWADDFHHIVRVAMAGDRETYFRDYEGTAEELARVYEEGWYYRGQESVRKGGPHGTRTKGLSGRAFVHCIQNHDQIGNRLFGDRLNQEVDLERYRTAVALLLLSPGLPLLFMGQEWGASTPFGYFTDHGEPLGSQVREGRKREYRHDHPKVDARLLARMPDPQAKETFEASRLKWEEREQEPHAGIWRLHRDLLRLRASEPAMRGEWSEQVRARAWAERGLVLRRDGEGGESIVALAAWKTPALAWIGEEEWVLEGLDVGRAEVVLRTEAKTYAIHGEEQEVRTGGGGLGVEFRVPSVVVFRVPRKDGAERP